jgi:hypothetical protein
MFGMIKLYEIVFLDPLKIKHLCYLGVSTSLQESGQEMVVVTGSGQTYLDPNKTM